MTHLQTRNIFFKILFISAFLLVPAFAFSTPEVMEKAGDWMRGYTIAKEVFSLISRTGINEGTGIGNEQPKPVLIEKAHTFIFGFSDVQGKLAFAGYDRQGSTVSPFAFFDGKYFPQRSLPVSVGSEVAFIIRKGDSNVVSIGDKEVYREIRNMPVISTSATSLIGVGNELAILIQENQPGKGISFFVLFQGKEGPRFPSIDRLAAVGGKPAFVGSLSGPGYRVVHGDVPGKQYSFIYGNLLEVNGKLAYGAGIGQKQIVVYGGVEYGADYEYAIKPIAVGNSLVFLAKKSGQMSRFFVVDGVAQAMPYESPYEDYLDIGGKLAFTASKKKASGNGYSRVVVWGSEDFGEEYQDAYGPFDAEGKLGFVAQQGNSIILVVDGKEIPTQAEAVNKVGWPTSINGKIAYVLFKDKGMAMVYGGFEGKTYDYVSPPKNIGGKLAYLARGGQDNNVLVYET
ncbi:hypothetical protein HYV84_03580 [Candidatus Woesearchaeota archaeon]|nr:hypothetical protein [Candidatus Woesearchaeota archaeon]